MAGFAGGRQLQRWREDIYGLSCFPTGKPSTTPSLIGGLRCEDYLFSRDDTLYIEFRSVEVAETKDLDENTLFDLDQDGNICGITIEHASERADIPHFSYEQVTT
jgi:uncharacterized protein YuzE